MHNLLSRPRQRQEAIKKLRWIQKVKQLRKTPQKQTIPRIPKTKQETILRDLFLPVNRCNKEDILKQEREVVIPSKRNKGLETNQTFELFLYYAPDGPHPKRSHSKSSKKSGS